MATKTLEKIELSSFFNKNYKVIFHNNDRTPMDVVSFIIKDVFEKSEQEAIMITLQVHHEGKAVVANYKIKEIAEMKVTKALRYIDLLQLTIVNDISLKITIEEY